MKNILYLFILIPVFAFGQLETYQFQDYRQGEFDLRQLVFSPRLNGLHSKETQFNLNPPFTAQYGQRNAGSLGIDLDFGRIVNTKFQQVNHNAVFNLAPSFSSVSNEDDEKESEVRFNLGGSYSTDVKSFTDYNKRFVGWFGAVSARNNYSNSESDLPDEKERIIYRDAGLTAGFQFGFGRIENISGAWQAVRLINRLQFTQLTDNDPPHELINAFGQEVDRIRAERVYDFRLGYQTQMAMLDAFVQDEIGVNRTDLKYYLELNDMWLFGISESRIMGEQINFKLSLNKSFLE